MFMFQHFMFCWDSVSLVFLMVLIINDGRTIYLDQLYFWMLILWRVEHWFLFTKLAHKLCLVWLQIQVLRHLYVIVVNFILEPMFGNALREWIFECYLGCVEIILERGYYCHEVFAWLLKIKKHTC